MSDDAGFPDFDAGSYSPPHRYGSTSRGRAHSPPAASGRRNLSPDYHSGGSHSKSRPRVDYGPDLLFAPPIAAGLAPPPQHHRPRSVPPPMTRDRDHRRRDDDEYDPDDPHKNSHTPVGKAKHVLHHTFTPSTSGLGVGVLGAIVGGLSAREASLAASRRVGHSKGGDESNKAALLSTIVGAAVGGLGANALEKRIESNRKKGKEEQEAWERKWGRDTNRRDDRDRDRDRDWDERDRDRDRDYRDRDARGSRELVRVRSRETFRDKDRDSVKDGRDPGPGRRGGLADDYYYSDGDDHVYDVGRGNRRSQSYR